MKKERTVDRIEGIAAGQPWVELNKEGATRLTKMNKMLATVQWGRGWGSLHTVQRNYGAQGRVEATFTRKRYGLLAEQQFSVAVHPSTAPPNHWDAPAELPTW